MADNEQRVEIPKRGIFSVIRNNFIYFAMVAAIIGSAFYGNFINRKDPISSEEHYEQDRIDKLENEKSRFPFYTVIIILFFLLYFVCDLVKNSKTFQQEAARNVERKPIFTNRISREEFERQKKEITDRELQRLFQSPNFKSMSEKKGQDKKNWVWQTQEKEKRTVFRDRAESDDENDRLSQITVSDD